MYITYNNTNNPCICRPAATMVYSGLPEDFPAPVDGEITLCADDGFVMRVDNSADYLRQTFTDGTLTLTNQPEAEEPVFPEPITPTGPSLDERVSTVEDELAALTAAIETGLSL